jgi:hypothetical protein
MKRWQELLREHDPGAVRLDAEAASRMRERVIREVRPSAVLAAVWPMRLALAGFACLVLTLSVFGTRTATDAPDSAATASGAERRQIQFATPGGTRIIWEINPEFSFGETIP